MVKTRFVIILLTTTKIKQPKYLMNPKNLNEVYARMRLPDKLIRYKIAYELITYTLNAATY